jgi:hypothetical protein
MQLWDQASPQKGRFPQARLPVKNGQGIFPHPQKDFSHFGGAPKKITMVLLCERMQA